MHSNYGGGVSEMQQFMMDGCPSSLFSISTSPPPQNSNSGTSEVQKFHPLQHHLQQQQQPMPQHFAHFGQPIPITQQLFQQSHHHHVHHHHQFQLFQQHQQQQQQHMGLDQESGPENSNSPARMMGGGGGGGGGPSFLAAMNFKLGVDESSGGGGGGGGSRDGINEGEGILQGDDDGSESRLHHHHQHHQHRQPWHREEESAASIKEPFWRPLDIDFINPNNKRPAKDKQPAAATTAEISSSSSIKHFKKSDDVVSASAAATDSNYKLFSELEAIYKPGGGGGGVGGGGGGETNNNQTGSGSALTGDDNPLVPATAQGPTAEHGQTDNISDTSNADDAPQKKAQRDDSNSGDAVRMRKRSSRKRRQQKQLSSIGAFFESLVKQLMDHQESLHSKFLEAMEKKDQERSAREEACRKQEAAKANREAAARAQERALAATREAAIISFLEKISGESLNLPAKAQFHSQFTEESQQKDNNEENAVEVYNADSANNNNNNSGGGLMQFSSSRWPKAEVQALIRVRSGFEAKFQEPGLKGPLWEEVSLAMATMGYQRSAKRCKEKWENINKYFRKTKDSGKKRPQHSKTCPYFHQLDQLYSKTPSLPNANPHGRKEKNSELLDAIVVSNEAKRNEEGNEEEGQGESQDQEENADDGDRSPVRAEQQNQEHDSSDRHLLDRLNS